MPCRLLLTDDHPVVLEGLTSFLQPQEDFQILATCSSGQTLLDYLSGASGSPLPDVLLLDLYMPGGLDGLSLLPILRRQWPQLRVIVLSTAQSAELIEHVIGAGAAGFLAKTAPVAEILRTIRQVQTGHLVFPQKVAPPPQSQKLADVLLRIERLTAREREVLRLLRQGLKTAAIARHLSRSTHTVTSHRRSLMRKLDVQNVAGLIQFANEHGL